MKAPLSYVPALPAAVGMAAGIIVYNIDFTFALIAVALSVIAFVVMYLRGIHYFAFLPMMFIVGVLVSYSADDAPLPSSCLSDKHDISAIVTGYPKESSRIDIAVDSVDGVRISPVDCSLTLNTLPYELQRGCRLHINATVSAINPAEQLPFVRSYDEYLLSKGIRYAISFPESVEVVGNPTAWQTMVNNINRNLSRAIVESPVSESAASFLLAVILGDKDYMDPGVEQSFRALGLAHMLALSGLHVGILASIISLLLLPVRITRRGRVISSVAVISLIWLYAIVCGMGPSIVRAAVMITVFTVSYYLQRGYNVFNSLLLSIVVMLCIDPRSMFTAGFQLSVTAVASILAFSRIVPGELRRRPILYFFANMTVVSISAMAATGIISAYYFHTLPIMFLPANILGGILFPFIFTGGVLLTVFTLCGIEFSLLGWVVDFLYKSLIWSADQLAAFGMPEIRGIDFSPWAMLPWFLSLAILAAMLMRHKTKSAANIPYRRNYLAPCILSATLIIVTVIIISTSSADVPSAELFITKHSRQTHIIYREGNDAVIHSLCDDADRHALAHISDKTYASYLTARNCRDTFAIADNGYANGSFKIAEPWMIAGDKLFYIASGDYIPSTETGNSIPDAVDYLLLTSTFSGDVEDLVDVLRPAMVLIAPDTHPKRRQKWLWLLTSPTTDLRETLFSLTWP